MWQRPDLFRLISDFKQSKSFTQTGDQQLSANNLGRNVMISFKKIMAGCDFSEYSKETLEYAAILAEKCQAELIVVNVINQRDMDTILKILDKTFDRTVERNVEKLADDYIKRETEKRTRQIDKLIEDSCRCAVSGVEPFDRS
jgi:hypothetical protein